MTRAGSCARSGQGFGDSRSCSWIGHRLQTPVSGESSPGEGAPGQGSRSRGRAGGGDDPGESAARKSRAAEARQGVSEVALRTSPRAEKAASRGPCPVAVPITHESTEAGGARPTPLPPGVGAPQGHPTPQRGASSPRSTRRKDPAKAGQPGIERSSGCSCPSVGCRHRCGGISPCRHSGPRGSPGGRDSAARPTFSATKDEGGTARERILRRARANVPGNAASRRVEQKGRFIVVQRCDETRDRIDERRPGPGFASS